MSRLKPRPTRPLPSRKNRTIPSNRWRSSGHALNFFPSHAARFGVCCKHIANGGHPDLRSPGQDSLDHLDDPRKWHAPIEKRLNRHFVRCVEGARIGAFLSQSFSREAQRGKTPRGNLLEIEAAQLTPIEGHFIRCRALRVG